MNKKGLSPLMATLLLIAFSVALGTIVMNWGQGYIAEKAEFVQSAHAAEVGCEGIDAGVVHIAGQPQVCIEDGTLKLFLENLANEPLQGMKARIAGSNDFQETENILDGPLGPAQSVHIRKNIAGLGNLLQVKLTPVIVEGTVSQYCIQNAVVLEAPFRAC